MRTPLFLLLIALLPSCIVTSRRVSMDDEGTQLAAIPLEGDAQVEWTLYPSRRNGEPKLGRTTTSTSEVAHVGLSVRAIDTKLAESLGVEPWRGVQVTRVVEGLPAQRAGLRTNDIVLTIDGVALNNDAQFIEQVRSAMAPRRPTTFVLLRGSKPESEGQRIELEILPEARPLTETRTDSFTLATDTDLLERTGLQVATIPPEHAAAIYSAPGPVAIVAGVVLGSPAYTGGLRGGDRILSCNGQSVTTAAELSQLLDRPATPKGDGASTKPPRHLDLEVEGPLGPHRAKVEVVSGVFGNSSLNIPIVFDCTKSADRTRWSFLDFIFQFGANYSSRDLRSSTREPQREWELSLFPLGMFEFERSPGRSSTTLFWLIRFKSS